MNWLNVLRPKQWYKNLLVFLPLIFSGNLTNATAIGNALLAFASFCALSSATYVINDCADKNKDRLHPEKSQRPIASGTINIIQAIFIVIVLIAIGFGMAFILPEIFLYAALGYFVLSQLYTLWFKYEAFADIITISINFVIRAVAGAFAIGVWVSPWLIVGIFFLALFLMLGKRRSELVLLQEKATFQRRTLTSYSPDVVQRLSAMATTTLVISYTLFVFFGEHQWLYVTLPVALYAVFRYEALISSGSHVARNPEYVFTDVRMVVAMLIWTILTLAVLY